MIRLRTVDVQKLKELCGEYTRHCDEPISTEEYLQCLIDYQWRQRSKHLHEGMLISRCWYINQQRRRWWQMW